MTERREPTLSGPVSDPAVSNDPKLGSSNARSSERSHSRSNQGTSSHNKRTSRPTPVSQRVVEVKSPLAPLALVAALIALSFAGLLFWQSSGQDEATKTLLNELQAAKVRIEQLEQQLTATGDESSQSLAGLAAGIKSLNSNVTENSSEIRKLWGVAHDRNRKAIEDNKNKVAAAVKSVASLKNAQQKDHKTLQAAMADLKGELAVLSEVQESQQAALSRSQNIAADLEVFKADVKRRVAANEEAVKSMDAFRLQVNRQLIQMGGSVTP